MKLLSLCVGTCLFYICERFGSCDYYDTNCSWDDICVGRKSYNHFDRTISGEWCDTPMMRNNHYKPIPLIARTETKYFQCMNYVHIPKRTFAPTPQQTIPAYLKIRTRSKSKPTLKISVVYAILN